MDTYYQRYELLRKLKNEADKNKYLKAFKEGYEFGWIDDYNGFEKTAVTAHLESLGLIEK